MKKNTSTNAKSLRRIAAAVLAAVLILTSLPLSCYAAFAPPASTKTYAWTNGRINTSSSANSSAYNGYIQGEEYWLTGTQTSKNGKLWYQIGYYTGSKATKTSYALATDLLDDPNFASYDVSVSGQHTTYKGYGSSSQSYGYIKDEKVTVIGPDRNGRQQVLYNVTGGKKIAYVSASAVKKSGGLRDVTGELINKAIQMRSLQTGKWLSVDPSKNPALANANAGANSVYETFFVLDAGDGWCALKSFCNGGYLKADFNNPPAILSCAPTADKTTQAAPGEWSKIKIYQDADTKIFYLKTKHGGYINAQDNTAGKPLAANGNPNAEISKLTWERFDLRVAFYTKDVPNNSTYFITYKDRYAVNIKGESKEDGAKAMLWTKESTADNEKFTFTKVGDAYKLTAKHSGRVLEVGGPVNQNGANIQQWSWADNWTNKLWYIIDLDDKVALLNKLTLKFLDVDNGVAGNGVKIHLYQNMAGETGQFTLSPVNTLYDYDANGWSDNGNYWNHPSSSGKFYGHLGVDYTKSGSNVAVPAIADGKVVYSEKTNANGNTVTLEHVVNGVTFYSFYSHMKDGTRVALGKTVKAGEAVGIMGNTGNVTGAHVHLGVYSGKMRGDQYGYNKLGGVNTKFNDGGKSYYDYNGNRFYDPQKFFSTRGSIIPGVSF